MTPHYEYKCRRCGVIDDSTQGGSREMARVIVSEVSRGGICAKFGIPVAPTGVHSCNDEGMGVTDFIGVSFKEDK